MTLLYALGYVVKYFKNKKHKVINDKKTSTNNVEKVVLEKCSVDQQFISNAYNEIILLSALSGLVGVLACLRRRIFYTQANSRNFSRSYDGGSSCLKFYLT